MAIVTAMAVWFALLPAFDARASELRLDTEVDIDFEENPDIEPFGRPEWLDQLLDGRFTHEDVRELLKLRSGFSYQYGEGTYVNSTTALRFSQLTPSLRATAMLVPAAAAGGSCSALPQEPVPVGGIDPSVLLCPTTLDVAGNTVCDGVGPVLGAVERVNSWNCTASAITENRVITAAHCLRQFVGPAASTYRPRDLKVVFGYNDVNGNAAVRTVAGGRIVYCRYDELQDVAVIELADKVPPGTAILERRTTAPTTGMLVHMASHPAGLPLRVSTCLGFDASCVPARVTTVDATWVRAPIDSLKGSSGASVVDDDGRLVGIFHGGFAEFAPEPTCDGDITYDDSCDGEWVSRADVLDSKLFDPSTVLLDATCDFRTPPKYGKACQ